MSVQVELVAYSKAPHGGTIATFATRYPMKIHWDLLMHRELSRSASSGRAISVTRMARWVEADPYEPPAWKSDATNLRPGDVLDDEMARQASVAWREATESALSSARQLRDIGVHRQDANGLLVPFGHINVVYTATNWDNLLSLRVADDVRPELLEVAVRMGRLLRDTTPRDLWSGEWHLPYVLPAERESFAPSLLLKMCTARCGRVSYLTEEGKAPDPEDDFRWHDARLADCHWNPFEHAARVSCDPSLRSGNFTGWLQYRQALPKSVHKAFDFSRLDAYDGRFLD